MTKQGSQELRECKQELRNIITGLERLETGVRNDFKNVGNDRCAASIHSVIEHYRSALRTLESISPSYLDTLKQAAEDARRAIEQSKRSGGVR